MSLFLSKDQAGTHFRIKPKSDEQWNDYYRLRKPVGLKRDLHWHEKYDLQNLIRKADVWSDFPAVGLTLVDAEFQGGDELQFVDLLYLRDDGGLLPCELKIGGELQEPHGQLIRYIADLSFQKLDLEAVNERRQHFMDAIIDKVAKHVHEQKFLRFIEQNKIADKFLRLLPRSGIVIDEDFAPQLLKAIRYLNHDCGFSIRMIRINAFVAEDWKPDASEFLMRLDFVDVQ
jgi:hypothetical protein